MKKMLVVTFALCALVASARTEDITVWRGETVTFILRDYLTVGSAPEGIAVKTGTAKEVRYLDRPLGTHYRSVADRVVWGCDDP